MASITAVNQLMERAKKLEVRAKNKAQADKATVEKVTGFGVALASAAGAGYVDGRYDVSGKDTVSGDGTRIFGLPIMPFISAGIGVTGALVGGKIGTHIMYSALGIACGSVYSHSGNAGRTAALKAQAGPAEE